MIQVNVKLMVGDIIVFEVDQNIQTIDLIKKLYEYDAVNFPKSFTQIIRSDDSIPYFNHEIVIAFVDMSRCRLDSRLALSKPGSLGTYRYVPIPNNNIVTILERDLEDIHRLGAKFMHITWENNGFTHNAYINHNDV
jgi:hypothetical protein